MRPPKRVIRLTRKSRLARLTRRLRCPQLKRLAAGSPLVERYVHFGVCRPGGHLVVQDFAASRDLVGSNRNPSDSGDEEAGKRG
jgi:hypothetical protein